MPVLDLFSKNHGVATTRDDPYTYDTLPESLRVQIAHMWNEYIGNDFLDNGGRLDAPMQTAWDLIEKLVAKEHGLFQLGRSYESAFVRCQQYLLAADFVHAMDLVQISFAFLDRALRQSPAAYAYDYAGRADRAIEELNRRFQDHRVGYQYVKGKLVRVDSDLVHAEVVVPALRLLHEVGFSGPEAEFLSAHAHYRAGRHEEAIADALKAFESTMKAICRARSWTSTDDRLTAKELIDVIFKQNLLPTWLTTEFAAARSTLEAGLPTVRNRLGGHGAGAVPRQVPAYFAGCALHVAAANILLLVAAHGSTP